MGVDSGRNRPWPLSSLASSSMLGCVREAANDCRVLEGSGDRLKGFSSSSEVGLEPPSYRAATSQLDQRAFARMIESSNERGRIY